MGKSTRWKFKDRGFKQVLNSPGTERMVRGQAYRIAKTAGEGFVATTFKGGFGGGRPIGVAKCTGEESRIAEATKKTLTRAVYGAANRH